MQLRIIQKPSKNFSQEQIQPKYIVLHCIGYSTEKALDILTKTVEEGGLGVSAHYYIPQTNIELENKYPVYQLVNDNFKAYHAGISQWHESTSLNANSIGIEFSCPDYAKALTDPEHLDWLHFEGFTSPQIEAGIILIKDLMKKYNIEPECVMGHSDISSWRLDPKGNTIRGKTDPGRLFPWEQLAKEGIGVWPKKEDSLRKVDISVARVQEFLLKAGYNVPKTGVLDLKTQYVLDAFHFHYFPNKLAGSPIGEDTVKALENLADKKYEYNLQENSVINSPALSPFI